MLGIKLIKDWVTKRTFEIYSVLVSRTSFPTLFELLLLTIVKLYQEKAKQFSLSVIGLFLNMCLITFESSIV